MSVFIKVTLYILGIIIPTIFSFYLGIWLQGDVKLLYVQGIDREVSIDNQEDRLLVTIDDLQFTSSQGKSANYRLVGMTVMNDDRRSLPGGEKFFFQVGDAPIPEEAIKNMRFNSFSNGDLIDVQPLQHNRFGTGFEVVSGLPGLSQVSITLTLDVGNFPHLKTNPVQLKKQASSNGQLEVGKKPHTITFEVRMFIIWLVFVAVIYSASWLVINVILGNYSTGAKILDWISRTLFGHGFIPP